MKTRWCIVLGETVENADSQMVSDIFYCPWMVRSLSVNGPALVEDLESRISW